MTKKHILVLAAVSLAILTILLTSKAASNTSDPILTLVPPPSPTPTQIKCTDDIQCLAIDYGISEVQLRETLRCESGFKHEGLFGDGGDAYGIAQFHFSTFHQFRKSAIKQGYPFEKFQYEDREDQIELTAWAFLNNYQRHWTCWTKKFGTPK